MNNDFARAVVPDHAALRSATSVAMMISSAAMGVPVMILGCSLGGQYGTARAVIVTILGCAVTALLASLLGRAGVKSRSSTALLATRAFGTSGAHVLNFAIALGLLGWFSVEIGFVGSMLDAGLRNVFDLRVGPSPGIIAASLLICAISAFGIGPVLRAPMILLPILATLLLCVLYLATRNIGFSPPIVANAAPMGSGVSAIVGAYIVGCLIVPDYTRFVRTSRAAIAATTFALGPIYGLVLITYALASTATGHGQPEAILLALGLPPIIGLLLPIGLIQNGVMCLYSSSLATSTVVPKVSPRLILVSLAGTGTVLALAGASAFFVPFLLILGVVFPPAVAVLIYVGSFAVTDAQAKDAAFRWSELCVWAIGVVAGVISEKFGIGVTGLSAFDGFLVAVAGAVAVYAHSKAHSKRHAKKPLSEAV